MPDFLRRSPLAAVLGIVLVALAGVLAFEYTLGGPAPVPTTVRKLAAADARLMPPLAAVAPDQVYPETAARPLFTPTRRPAPEAVAVQQPTFQRGQFTLLGVIIVGSAKTAMLREKSTGRLHRVEVGREVNGIKLQQIDRESVTLAMGAETESVPLSVQRPGAPAAPGSPGAPGQPGTPPASLGGPFGTASAPAAAQGMPAGQAPGFGGTAPPLPSFMQSPTPTVPGGSFGMPQQAPAGAGATMPMQTPQAAAAAAAAASAQQALTPEEILARRRARRAQQTQ